MKLNYFPLYFSIIIFNSTISYTQSNQLDNIYIKKITPSLSLDSVLYYSKKLQKSTDSCMVYTGRINELGVYYKKGNYTLVEKSMTKLLHKLNNLDLHCRLTSKVSILNRLFWIKKNQNKLDEAFSLLIERLRVVDSFPLKNSHYFIHKLSVTSNMAIIKSKLGLDQEAISILKSTNNDLEKLNIISSNKYYSYFLTHQSGNLNKIANSYYKLNKLDSAKIYYNNAYQITKKIPDSDNNSKVLYNIRIAGVLIKQKKYKNALDLIKKNNINNTLFSIKKDIYFLKSTIYHNIHNSDSAIYYGKKYLKTENTSSKTTKNTSKIHTLLATEYGNKKKIDSAYKYSQLTLEQYALARIDKEKTFNSLYKNDYNQAQKLNVRIIEGESLKQQKIIGAFISLLSVLLIIIFLFLRKEKKNKKELLTKIDSQKPNKTEKKEYNIDKALENKILLEIENINENLDFLKFDFSISSIAQNLKTNSTYVSFVFNKHYNESFKQYFTKRKIEYIVELLKNNKTYRMYSVQALAEETGYTNASAFTRVFKKQMGVTPSVFLKTLDE